MANGDVQTLTLVARVMTAGTLSTTAELTASTAADVDSTPNNHVVSEDDQQTNAAVTTGASLGDTVWYDVDLDATPGRRRAGAGRGVRHRDLGRSERHPRRFR